MRLPFHGAGRFQVLQGIQRVRQSADEKEEKSHARSRRSLIGQEKDEDPKRAGPRYCPCSKSRKLWWAKEEGKADDAYIEELVVQALRWPMGIVLVG